MAYLGNTIVGGTLKVLNDVNANKVSGDGSGLTALNASNISSGTLNAARLATSGASAGSYGPSAAVTGTNNTTMNVPYITVDAYGRVTSISNKVYTSKDTVYTHPTTAGNIHLPSGGASGNFLKWSSAGTGKWESLTKSEVTTALGYTPPTTNTTYSAGTGLSLSGTKFNHSNSVTAGTAGTSSATSGSTLAVPYVTYDAQGHITATGTHTHTVSGFLTAHQTIKQNGVTGATGNCYGACSTAAATAAKAVSITAGTPTLEAGLKVTVKFANANTAGTPTLNVNSLGAKNIFHNGAKITTGANKALLAGVCDFVYDGTQFHLVGNYLDTNTTYSGSNGISLSGTTFSNSGVRSVATGSANGTISVNTNGTAADVAVKGLGTAAYTASTAYAAASHGNHVPTTQTANNAVFLRNDNSWQTVTPANIGAAASNHTHSNYLTSHQTIKQDAVTGATGNRYGACSTAAATAAKTVSITAGTPALEAGLKVTVKFANANTANSPTLNVNSLGAKNIFHNGAQITTGANKALLAGACDFVYDGTQFHLVGNYIDTNTHTITGVKGNSESTYRTGNVNLTAANIGAAASNHNHSGVYTPYAASVGSNQKFIYTNSSGALTAANFEIWVTDT